MKFLNLPKCVCGSSYPTSLLCKKVHGKNVLRHEYQCSSDYYFLTSLIISRIFPQIGILVNFLTYPKGTILFNQKRYSMKTSNIFNKTLIALSLAATSLFIV